MTLPMRYSAFQKEPQKPLLANATPNRARRLAMGWSSVLGRRHQSRGAPRDMTVMLAGGMD